MKKLLFIALLSCSQVFGQTKDEVLIELKAQNVLYPEIVLAQSILETGWYTCKNCSLDNNNLFGLWNSKKQEYYYYSEWKHSIGGYKKGIQYKYYKKEYKDYYHFLNDIGYATDPRYIIKLKSIVKRLNSAN